MANTLILEKDYDKAQRMIDEGKRLEPRRLLLQQGLLCALTGRRKEAEEVLREISAEEGETTLRHSKVFICSALGKLDEAFEALGKQAEEHSWYYLLQTNPILESAAGPALS